MQQQKHKQQNETGSGYYINNGSNNVAYARIKNMQLPERPL
jgi:hypothetical protein